MTFQPFASAVYTRFTEMSKRELYVVDVSGDEVYEKYLASFPEGSNPIYKTRTEHDCSCCKNFIRNIGNVVAIVDGKLESIWGGEGAEYPYNTVAAALDELVTSKQIVGVFRVSEPQYGAETSRQLLEDGSVKTWNHFHAKINRRHLCAGPGEARGAFKATAQVFQRGLEELTADAIQTVIELIEANALYRGQEHLAAVREFQKMHKIYQNTPADGRNIRVWDNVGSPAARFRNTVIGTLVQDLSNGVDLEAAVRSFEAKVAPENYKRPTAIITPRMVEDAMKTIRELDLEPALERRFARISDVTINNVLWANNTAKAHMKGGVAGLLMDAATSLAPKTSQVEDIGIDEFMSKVLPSVTSMDILVKNAHMGNFMSLTAPVHADVPRLFKWSNDFSWSYNGNVADSIKERVKKAGGKIEGDLCCRLAWDYKDDLDFYMREPSGHTIYFSNRRRLSPCGGVLDVDANGADGLRDDPVENIVYADKEKMWEGTYTLEVNNYSRRSEGVGFEVEIEFGGQVHHITYNKVLRTNDTVRVAKLKYTKTGGIEIIESLPSTATSKSVWGVDTEKFVRVQTLMHSPNHWDDNAVGNKHWFFILEGCKNDTPTRGIYNEFLNSALDKHRKVFEILGDRTKCQPTDDQLSGLGFSSTRNDTVTVQVKGAKLQKTFNISF